jgi:hypothetical protein
MATAIMSPHDQRSREFRGGIHHEHCIEIGVVNEQRKDRAREL